MYVLCMFNFSFIIFLREVLNSWNENSCRIWCVHSIYVAHGSIVLSYFLSVSCRGVTYVIVSGWMYAMTWVSRYSDS
jgi:hypothetical protein